MESNNGQPVASRKTKSGKYQLADLTVADLRKCDWSKIGQELPAEDLAEIIQLLKESEVQGDVEKEYLEMLKGVDQLSCLADVIQESESPAAERTT